MLAQCLMSMDMEPAARDSAPAGAADGGGGEEALWQAALNHASKSTSTRPDWPPALLTYGRCLRNVGLSDEALRALNNAAEWVQPDGLGRPQGGRCTHAPRPQWPPGSPNGHVHACPADASSRPPVDWDVEVEAEVREELQEVRQLWAQRLARQVGLPGLRLMQDEGTLGGGQAARAASLGVPCAPGGIPGG
ncbi:hypothetical protein CHLRE_12g542200v5 [Chlamydomonas reinhardtii]|uniref:Uncharacterized protein n=1 Tax=Chlamydomonas reinhardtii TaxID=3055 RepID=A0A2K3D6T7_CHLRE|nr:uncharacterized protein CHLRE_12g542200v5 [Chlamydomonas reinhardtii]PNW76246.1 hypothetical protein CHLRE_12g542200v5 [Chlamydomonas reinhardtii]